jgi:hypothetical protein
MLSEVNTGMSEKHLVTAFMGSEINLLNNLDDLRACLPHYANDCCGENRSNKLIPLFYDFVIEYQGVKKNKVKSGKRYLAGLLSEKSANCAHSSRPNSYHGCPEGM